MTTQTATVQTLRAAPEAQMPIVAPGFGSLQGFELMQRAARLLSSSTLVPVAYRQTIEKLDRFGNVKESRENPNALANSVVALNMAQRMGADPLMVMQNLYIVEGRPSWSSQWIIAAINGCGRFSPLRFRIESRGEREIEYKSTYWESNQRHTKVEKVRINDKVCVAWAIEKETGEVIESPAVSIEMAVLEGWYTKNGSKWQTMDEVMLRYRTASFFGKLYAPELLMGLQTVEEAQDIIEASTGPDGTISVNVDELRGSAAPTQRQPAAADVTDVESRDTKAAQAAPDTALAKAQAETDDPAQTAAPDVATNADPTAGASEDDGGEALDPAKVEEQLRAAKSLDVLDIAADYLPGIADIEERDRLNRLYQQLRLTLTSAQQRAPRRRVAAPE
ncbi:hypothetical protein LP085_08565 [Achromobacter sp. MY14]|uniref:hypothetical protein n=1 Tax=unclassified Achromobacter TaxID=2626865 RepID=UPI001E46A17A|nr:hypothetical protein [Achromobacter sp. MY14]MCD0496896.1 hypothetical protein [Achromobacter sp. MY14]